MNETDHLQNLASDPDLLADYSATGRQEAFAQLIQRHGAMVLGACRSVLGNSADAEDAAQAVFLTLARKAASLRAHASVAGWLHRVARYVALHAREAAAIRRRHEQEAARMKQESQSQEKSMPGEQIHAALATIPEKYRIALLLHHVEGHTEEDTAKLLRCSYGALSSRLSRGRKMLRRRMLTDGSPGTVAAVAEALSQQDAAAPSVAFVESTLKIAVALAAGKGVEIPAGVTTLYEGALHMLKLARWKLAAGAVAALFVVAGATVYVERQLAAAAAPPTPPGVPVATAAVPATAQGLKLTLSFSPERNLLVAFHNASTKPFVLNIGDMLGNGISLFPTLVEIQVIVPRQGIRKYVNQPGFVGGRVDDWLIPLAPGDTYTLSIDPQTLKDTANFEPLNLPVGAKLKVYFEGTGEQKRVVTIPALPLWKGTVESTEEEMPVQVRRPQGGP